MDVSVIIPFYNNVGWLYEAVNSIDERDTLSLEIIIINDGSKERIDTKNINRNKSEIQIINQDNQGPGRARNTGIAYAKGEYIAFLDSDDLFTKDKLSKQIDFMKNNNYIWTHSSYIKFFENGERELIQNKKYFGMVFPNCLAYNPIATPTVMVKREALENPIKRFSEIMRFGQDGFMWSQLAAYYEVGVIEEPLAQVRMHGSNATLKAKNHLYVKSNMYQYMKQNDKYFNRKKIPIFLNMVFALANLNYKFIELFFHGNNNNKFIEILSRILYSSQYIALRFYKLIWMRQKSFDVTTKN